MSAAHAPVVALSGGVGGAKLAHGLARTAPAGGLVVVANTGDDFEHLGLRICPDIDTLVYTLSDTADTTRGWGRADETWHFLEALERLGGPDWFRLGDRDLAMHVLRTERLRSGRLLSAVTRELATALGIDTPIVPMSDDPVRTILDTDEGLLDFQDYFVHRQCRPRVRAIEYRGARSARPSPPLAALLAGDVPCAAVLCPSNPHLSIDPILAVPDVRAWLERSTVRVVAVSPIVGGEALKGPAAKLLRELAGSSSALAIAEHYAGLLDILVIDEQDAHLAPRIEALGISVQVDDTVMRSIPDRDRLARRVLRCLA
ncbi:MAG: 2-phospho-L-lactate transferase [Gammaproteobacteria bacterium]|nr:2-phospho-L-lactate transferase [Gammaproteobacteria bacterium]